MNLTAENICVTLGDKKILQNVSCNFVEGKRTAIIGPNGAGKSTFLKIICLLNEKFTGKIFLNGEDIKSLGRKKIAKVMAILPQEREIPQDTTVRQLAEFGRFPHRNFFGGKSSEDIQAVEEALEFTQTKIFENRQVASLSGGERQRAWLAMTLAQRPKILLLDEPTTYLDIAHQLEVMKIVCDVNKNFGMTVIMVLHDINHARLYADEVVVMKGGKIFAVGEPKKILTTDFVGKIFDVEAENFINSKGDSVIIPTKKIIPT